MKNADKRTLKLTRSQVCDIRLALLAIIMEAKNEMASPETTPDRKKILEGTISKWSALRAEVINQLSAQDNKIVVYSGVEVDGLTYGGEYTIDKKIIVAGKFLGYTVFDDTGARQYISKADIM